MTTIQFVLIMAWLGAAFFVVGWISYQSSSPHPARAYTAIKSRVDGLFTVLAWPIDWLLRRLFG